MACRMRKPGYFYPMFYLPKPVRLDRGPVYLSGYVKIEAQHPEANHRVTLACAGYFPKKKPGVWGGLEIRATQCVQVRDGWLYVYSRELGPQARRLAAKRGLEFDGACVSSFYVRMWNLRAGEVVRFRLDDVRLTRDNPVPPPTEAAYRRARELHQQMVSDRAALARVAGAAELSADLDEAARLAEAAKAHPDRVTRARFVGKIQEMEKAYWRLKLLRLAAE